MINPLRIPKTLFPFLPASFPLQTPLREWVIWIRPWRHGSWPNTIRHWSLHWDLTSCLTNSSYHASCSAPTDCKGWPFAGWFASKQHTEKVHFIREVQFNLLQIDLSVIRLYQSSEEPCTWYWTGAPWLGTVLRNLDSSLLNPEYILSNTETRPILIIKKFFRQRHLHGIPGEAANVIWNNYICISF